MPASPARVAANRANAQRSTGPLPPHGKPARALIALPHRASAAHFRPAGPVEAHLVRRLAALAVRADLLTQALDALLLLGERRALLDHLEERYALDRDHLRLRSGHSPWSHALLRYDGAAADP